MKNTSTNKISSYLFALRFVIQLLRNAFSLPMSTLIVKMVKRSLVNIRCNYKK